jgi:hypothetical protein
VIGSPLFINKPIHLINGFGVSINHHLIYNSGNYLTKTSTGFYKKQYMCILNQELYLFSDKNSTSYNKMIILTPGVFIKKCKPITNMNNKEEGKKTQKVHPIEVNVGG